MHPLIEMCYTTTGKKTTCFVKCVAGSPYCFVILYFYHFVNYV